MRTHVQARKRVVELHHEASLARREMPSSVDPLLHVDRKRTTVNLPTLLADEVVELEEADEVV